MEPEREILAFCAHVEALLGGDEAYCSLWKEPSDLLAYLRDGILLGDIIQSIEPGVIDVRKLKRNVDVSKINRSRSGDVHEIYNNLNICLASVQAMGIKLVNTGPEDFIEMNVHIVLGVIWQLVRKSLMTKVNLEDHPELVRLLGRGEKLRQLISLSGEQLLLRWVNYHLAKDDSKAKPITTFKRLSVDQLMSLMLQIVPRKLETTLKAKIKASRRLSCTSKAQFAVDCAELLGCRKFIGVATLVNGDPRLMHAFVATLFNSHIGIQLPSEIEIRDMVYRIGVLSDEVQRLRKRLETAEANNGVVVHIQTELMELREELKLADKEADEAERDIEKLKKTADDKDQEIHRLEQKLGTADADLGETKSTIGDFHCEIISLKEELQRAQSHNVNMQATMKRLEEEKSKIQHAHREMRSQGISVKSKMHDVDETIRQACTLMTEHLDVSGPEMEDQTPTERLENLVLEMIANSSKQRLALDQTVSQNESLKMRQEVLLDKTAAIAEAQLSDHKYQNDGSLTPMKMMKKWGNSVGKVAKNAGGSLLRSSNKRDIKSVRNMNFEPPTTPLQPRANVQKTPLRGARQMVQGVDSKTACLAGTGEDTIASPKHVSFRTRSNSSPGRIASPGRIDLDQDVSTNEIAKSIMERAMRRAEAAIETTRSEKENASPTLSIRSYTGIPERSVNDENNPLANNMKTTISSDIIKVSYVEDDGPEIVAAPPAIKSVETPKHRRRRPREREPLRPQQV